MLQLSWVSVHLQDGSLKTLDAEEIEALWRYVPKPLLHIGAHVSPSHIQTMSDILRAQGVIKVSPDLLFVVHDP